jgi:hypothetical protein
MKKAILAVALILLAGVTLVHAGGVDGPVAHTDRVQAHTTDVYRVQFEADEMARVGVIGDGDTELVLLVYDARGNLIAQDSGTTCAVEWTPRWTGSFTIKVRNRGSVCNDYLLLAN